MPSPEPRRAGLLIGGGVFVLLLCGLSTVYFDRVAINYFLAADPFSLKIFDAMTQWGDSLYSLLLGAGLYFGCRLRLRGKIDAAKRLWLERWQQRGLFLFVAVASSGLLTDLIKFICGRARPVKLLTENLYGFSFFETSSKMTSFPSGHSNTAAAIALVVWYIWPKSWPLGLLLTGGVMLSRVALLKHYPSDTLAGAYLAVVTTFYLFHLFRRRYPALFTRGDL
ncbi:phosphatase PAP2 family protein [Geopsychrobacter electrodiphilus]|uniref:phosphatase PAP2 family protein n=1 Tax=Geopsychrobacter electrodiphilus TaxID=225196 RepID=UPI00037427C8|nr:phosphatase PAP2 family protein [Geopsychrobacter electrodiphilus]